jgi:F-type H+-transporting ATPase subunit epsilon
MKNTTKLELITPSKIVVQENIEMVVVPGSEGHFGVLPLHSSTLSSLKKGVVDLYQDNNIIKRIIIDGGIADVQPDGCILLVERAEDLNNLKQDDIQRRITKTKESIVNPDNESEKISASKEISWLEFILESI